MPHPGTTFTWHDQSAINTNVNIDAVDNAPLFLTVSSFDRGPEDLRVVTNKDFYNLYGNKMNFAAHGQPALQAANIINGGGKLLIKRLVAEDAQLANLIGIATVKEVVNTVKAAEGDPNGKTLGELLNGVADEPVEYVEALELMSSVGDTDDSTVITVGSTLGVGNSYKWRETSSDMLPVVNTKVDSDFVDWDGLSDISAVDGTKIQIVEVNVNNTIVKSGVINVVSRIPHPATSSSAPDTDINTLFVTSKEGTNEGFTELVVSPVIASGNKYFYKIVDKDDIIVFPTTADIYDDVEITNWTEWNGLDQLELAEGSQMVLCEFKVDEVTNEDSIPEGDTPTVIGYNYSAVKGALVIVVSKLPADTRTSEEVEPIKPGNDLFIIASQDNFVKWGAVSVTNCKTINEVVEEAKKAFVENEPTMVNIADGGIEITKSTSYPMFIAVDNGRGVSSKAIRFVPDYITSKDMKNMFFTAYVYEGTNMLENVACTMNPYATFNNTLYGLNNDTSIQVKFETIPGVYEAYLEHLVELTGYTVEQLNKFDVMFMTSSKGTGMINISLDDESVDFGADYGVCLDCGSNGEFGEVPFGTEPYIKAAIEVLDGTYDDIIWDVDTYKIAATFDANYPEPVKDAFAAFANFREDHIFFRDYGIDVYTYSSIVDKYNSISTKYKTKYSMEYYTTYQIYDPETKMRIRTTMLYDFARAMVAHFANGVYRPLAGVANNMILASAIEGTINFTPRITPKVNQKELLDDLRINYAIFEEGRCVVQSLYTSQKEYTQLSYGNNVLAIQEVIRAVRVSCPKHRYTFTSGNDFTSYADAVNNVLRGFNSNFAELEFGYEQNSLKAAQKIFYATIYFRFNNWAQTEHFDLYALGNE